MYVCVCVSGTMSSDGALKEKSLFIQSIVSKSCFVLKCLLFSLVGNREHRMTSFVNDILY